MKKLIYTVLISLFCSCNIKLYTHPPEINATVLREIPTSEKHIKKYGYKYLLQSESGRTFMKYVKEKRIIGQCYTVTL